LAQKYLAAAAPSSTFSGDSIVDIEGQIAARIC